ncbi:MAG: universal stress protein [Bacteroidota bacterium]|nr:universal stress protein [Bacteroidota bacterium]
MKKGDIKRILVPVDFSETSEISLVEAMTLAKRLSAEVFILHVIESSGYYYSIFPEKSVALPSFNEVKKAVNQKMEILQGKLAKKYGVTIHPFIVNGHIDTEIIALAKKKKIDMIFMGTHGASGYKEVFIGSNAQHVVTLSNVPVITIQQKKDKAGFKNILIPIDDSLHSREKVNIAMLIAETFKSYIHLIGLPETKDEEEVNKINIKLASVEKIINDSKLGYKTTVVHGKNLAKAAIKYAKENNCDLIVINTGHESQTGIFLGALAQQIVNHSSIPVLSFKHSEDHYSADTPAFGI